MTKYSKRRMKPRLTSSMIQMTINTENHSNMYARNGGCKDPNTHQTGSGSESLTAKATPNKSSRTCAEATRRNMNNGSSRLKPSKSGVKKGLTMTPNSTQYSILTHCVSIYGIHPAAYIYNWLPGT